MRWYCTAIFTLSCSLSGMEIETHYSYYTNRISSVQLSDQHGTTLPADTFMRAYDALLKLRKRSNGQRHLREILNKCRNNQHYVLDPETISIMKEPLQLVNRQFQDPRIQLLCTFVLEKKPDCPLRGPAPITVRAPKGAIAKVELKKKDRLD